MFDLSIPTLYESECREVQGVPLATEPGTSLIILTQMKILQRNLNRSTFFSFTFRAECQLQISLQYPH